MAKDFQTKNLRKLDDKKLIEILKQVNEELWVFKSSRTGYANPRLPAGTGQGTIDWGRCKQLKKVRARIFTILNERGIKVV